MSKAKTSTLLQVSGFEVPESVTFKKWEAGREYIKNLVLKNVQIKLQKLRYTSLATSWFSIALPPAQVSISAGTSLTIPITFRPTKPDPVEDSITFETLDGVTFTVPIRAVLPKPELSFPEKLQFGAVPAGIEQELRFTLKNTSDMTTVWRLQCAKPFAVRPQFGELDARQSCEITVTFLPEEALIYEAPLIIKCDSGEMASFSMALEGCGRFAHLLVQPSQDPKYANLTISPSTTGSVHTLKFPDTLVSESSHMRFRLENPTVVPAHITVNHVYPTTELTPSCKLSFKKMQIGGRQSGEVTASFQPHRVNQDIIEYFDISVVKGTTVRIACQGRCAGPMVVSSTHTFKFAGVQCATSSTRSFVLANKSSVSVPFKFEVETGSVYKFEPSSGNLSPNESKNVSIVFQPTLPGHFYRVINCIIQHHAPLAFECLGTAHFNGSESIPPFRPYPISEQHVTAHKRRTANGLGHYGPEQLRDMLNKKAVTIDSNGELAHSQSQREDTASLKFQPSLIRNATTPTTNGKHSVAGKSGTAQRLTTGGNSTSLNTPGADARRDTMLRSQVQFAPVLLDMNQFFSVSASSIDFAAYTVRKGKPLPAATRPVTVTNSTASTVTCSWTASADLKMPFFAEPAQGEIAAGESRQFTLCFLPDQAERFYQGEVECYLAYSEMLKEETVSDSVFSIPICMSVGVAGHTFSAMVPAPPNVSFSSLEVGFPVTQPKVPTYETVVLRNQGQSSLKFEFKQPDDASWTVLPPCGILAPNQEQVLLFRVLPSAPGAFQHPATCFFNNDPDNSRTIVLIGVAQTPSISLDHDGLLYFAPAASGHASTSVHSVKNTSGLPVFYEWRLSTEVARVFKVEPRSGTLQPYESREHTWSFVPISSKPVSAKIACAYRVADSVISTDTALISSRASSAPRKQTESSVSFSRPTTAASGVPDRSLSWRKAVLVLAGQGARGELYASCNTLDLGTLIVGTSHARTIELHNASLAPIDFKLQHTGGDELSLEYTEGTLGPRSRKKLIITATPTQEGNSQVQISYELVGASKPRHESLAPLCEVNMSNVWPRLAVTDVASESIAKARLWRLFNLTSLNKVLSPKLHKDAASDVVPMQFPSAPVGCFDTVIKLEFSNPCVCPMEWSIVFPYDDAYKPEPWAGTQILTDDEKRTARIETNKLFSIIPQRGTLQPGKSCVVDFINKHPLLGEDSVEVVLRIANRQDVRLVLQSHVLPANSGYIEIVDSTHEFEPVVVGITEVPTQFYTLYNTGDRDAVFSLDVSSLQAVNEANYDFQIFECGLTEGTIPAGGLMVLPWRFHPLEAKAYRAHVPIVPVGNSSFPPVAVDFVGQGVVGETTDSCKQRKDQKKKHVSKFASIPWQPRITFGSQLAQLSCDGLDLGSLPAFGVVRRSLFVNNISNEHSISFSWNLGSFSKVIRMTPSTGVIAPGESKLCKLVFNACDGPHVYECDLACEVMDENELKQYQKSVLAANAARELARNEFTYTDKGRTGNLRAGGYLLAENPIGVRGSLLPVGTFPELDWPTGPTPILAKFLSSWRADRPYSTSPDIDKEMVLPTQTLALDSEMRSKKYTALPPIKLQSNVVVEEPRRPSPPQKLHLFIKCMTGPIAASPRDFVLRTMGSTTAATAATQSDAPRLWSEENGESSVVTELLSNLLQDLVNDCSFQDAVLQSDSVPLPFFEQFRTKKSSHSIANAPRPPTSQADARQLQASSARPHTRGGAQPISSTPSQAFLTSNAMEPDADADTDVEYVADASTTIDSENILFSAEFQSLAEEILDMTLSNILAEAESAEFSLTARSRMVALPPRSR